MMISKYHTAPGLTINIRYLPSFPSPLDPTRMRASLILATLLLQVTLAQWGTYYSFEEGLIYLRLKNNDFIALNFSLSGFGDISSDSLSYYNLYQDQTIQSLSPPPENSSLFVQDKTLYAFTGAVDENLAEYDKCGDGIFQLLEYDSANNTWDHATESMAFSNVDDVSFYQDSTYLTSSSASQIYIYGGLCSATGEIVDRLLSFDLNKMSFSNITTATTPQAFYGGSSVWAPTPSQSFVIGGRSDDGWLNMYQLATWSFSSGWSSEEIMKNGSETVSSRTSPLVLPVFSVLSDNSSSTFNREYSVSKVIMFGGDSNGSEDLQWAQLAYEDNAWSWEVLSPSLQSDDVYGAAIIFNTLVVVNGSAADISKTKRQETTYTLNLFDVDDNFKAVSDLKSSTATSASSSSRSSSSAISKTTKILVGTLVPLFALTSIIGTVVGIYFWKTKKAAKEESSIADPMDYQLGHYRTESEQPYSLLGSQPLNLYIQSNETSSTLDVASMDSWVRKRQEYDATQQRPLNRDSYLASNETLNSLPEEVDDESDSAAECASSGEETPDAPTQKTHPVSAVPLRLGQLKQSFSYSQTPPQSPVLRQKSHFDPGHIGVSDSWLARADDKSFDDNMDVQVLVSSKRKSVLRVVNPDAESLHGESVRLRNVSK